MSISDSEISGGEPWYTYSGSDEDVVVSTRVRLVRNLANFPFPMRFRGDDCDRVQSLVLDSVSQFDDPDNYHTIDASALDELGTKVLTERGVLDMPSGTGIILRADGRVACVINSCDHVRISSFSSGLDCEGAMKECLSMDTGLQKTLQFAASFEFGYLTSNLNDTGSGMKLSLRVHLPSLSFAGLLENLFRDLKEKGFSVSAAFGTGGSYGASLGAYYHIFTTNACSGSEFDQMAGLEAAGKYICETERKIRTECADNKPTEIHNSVLRSYALAKFSALVSLREAVEIISAVKWGLDLGIIAGIDDSTLCGLLYRIQNGHLEYLLKNGSFSFEKDIENSLPQKTDRLRAIILQEAFEKIQFVS